MDIQLVFESATANGYVRFLALLALTFFVLHYLHVAATAFLTHVVQKTKTDLDDVIFDIIQKPMYAFVLVGGLYMSFGQIAVLEAHRETFDAVFFSISLLLATFVLSRILAIILTRWLKVHKKYEKTPKLITKIITIAIYLVGLLIILDYFNVEITPIIATLGIGGLAIGLALQNTLTNLFAGVHLISDRPINIGDFIELEGGTITGYVEDIGWRSTRIRTILNTITIVPNAKLAESIIFNDSMPEQELAVYVDCGVDYTSDLQKVESVTIEVAKKIQSEVPGAVPTFEPFVRFINFGDSNINFRVILRVSEYIDRFRVIHEFIKQLHARYAKEGIEISWPIRKIYNMNQEEE